MASASPPDGVEVTHEPPEDPDAVLTTTTDALLAAFGNDDLRGLTAVGSAIVGDPGAEGRLLRAVQVPRPAMAAFGLDPSAWLASGPATVVTFDATRFPDDGAVEDIRRRHFELHGRSEDGWLSEITAVEAKPSRRGNAAEG